MAAKKVTLEEPMMLVNLGGWGTNYILPWDSAVQLLTLMRDAVKVESDYTDGKTVWKKAKGEPVSATAFATEHQAQILMSGEPS